MKSLNVSPITDLATTTAFFLFPLSCSASTLDLATFIALARNSVFCMESRTLKSSIRTKSKDRKCAQSVSSFKSLRFITLLNSRCMKSHTCPHEKSLVTFWLQRHFERLTRLWDYNFEKNPSKFRKQIPSNLRIKCLCVKQNHFIELPTICNK